MLLFVKIGIRAATRLVQVPPMTALDQSIEAAGRFVQVVVYNDGLVKLLTILTWPTELGGELLVVRLSNKFVPLYGAHGKGIIALCVMVRSPISTALFVAVMGAKKVLVPRKVVGPVKRTLLPIPVNVEKVATLPSSPINALVKPSVFQFVLSRPPPSIGTTL